MTGHFEYLCLEVRWGLAVEALDRAFANVCSSGGSSPPGPDLGGPGGPGPQASHQQGVSHQTPQFLKPCNSIANHFLKSQIRHWALASH